MGDAEQAGIDGLHAEIADLTAVAHCSPAWRGALRSRPDAAEAYARGYSAIDPRDPPTDAPSAEAGQPTAFEKVADYIVPYHDAIAQQAPRG